jgi:hypothetical protein
MAGRAGTASAGVVTQGIQEVVREIVVGDEEGTLGVAYTSLIPVLIHSIQQQEQLEELQDRLAEPEGGRTQQG